MTKILMVLSVLLLAVSSFNIYESVIAVKQNELKDIPWPYTVCGTGKWTI
jgi:hypothetical protein